MKNESVGIILLNWNSYFDTYDCLKSLELITYSPFHIYIADNNSNDDSFDRLKKDYREKKFNLKITFLQTGSNLGFAGGNNVALKLAYQHGHKYFWLLNNDTVVDREALSELIKTINKSMDYGVVGSKILYYDTKKIWFAGGTISKITGSPNHLGFGEIDNGQYNQEQDVDYITGCSLLIRSNILKDVGYMDEDYFLYFEETDWNIKIASKGYRLVYSPNSIVYHKVSSSTGGDKEPAPFIDYYLIRNRYLITRRNKKYFNTITSFLFLIIVFLKKFIKIIFIYRKNRIIRLKYLMYGILDGIRKKSGKHPQF
ncbi:glycosyltransferase family 2 protein [Bacillus sp. MB2021]|uniref:glycosyltransferase family 2 protein n=1 Tax=Bacillus sp. MB2021 TaxID=1408303 RepID=UPI00068B4DE8|nr:glycosyltransferase family 2 protein [Bacillus sp. MB2021]